MSTEESHQAMDVDADDAVSTIEDSQDINESETTVSTEEVGSSALGKKKLKKQVSSGDFNRINLTVLKV